MAEKLLTDKQLKSAKARDREYLLKDGGALYARVRPAADGGVSISWQFAFKWNGRPDRLSIGPYPAVSLVSARARRDEARELLKGNPPRHPVLESRRIAAEAHAKAAAEASERTVRTLFSDFKSIYLEAARKDGGASAEELFEKNVFPLVGALRARAVTRAHISSLVDRVVARSARRQANVLLSELKQLFKWGTVKGYVDVDPTYGFTKAHAGGEERPRERALSRDELVELARKLPASGLAEWQQAAIRFLLATGARVGELNKALWVAVDKVGRTWTIPKENAKNGREHIVHLSVFALDALGVLERWRVNPYLLPSRKDDAPIDAKALTKSIRDRQREKPLRGRSRADLGALALAGGDWSAHDLRRTFATQLAELGALPHVVERALNHTMQGVMAVYNRHDYAAERRSALDQWGAQLERCFAAPRNTAANVVNLIPKLAGRRRRSQ